MFDYIYVNTIKNRNINYNIPVFLDFFSKLINLLSK